MTASTPRISLVTPSFNQGSFLGHAIRSVLDQGHPSLEYVVIDGGSHDNSVAILRRFDSQLHSWSSAPDRGMYDALNQGFARTRGEIMGWLNADDLHLPGTLATVDTVFQCFPDIEWLTTLRPATCDQHGQRRWTRRLPGFHRTAFARGEYVVGVAPFWSGWIPQESTFWRRSLWRRAGATLDDRLEHAGDFDLWNRFYGLADLVGIDQALGVFRRQPAQKTAVALDAYIAEARAVLLANGAPINGPLRALARKVVTRLPEPLRRPAQGMGLAYPSTVIERHHGAWRRRAVPV